MSSEDRISLHQMDPKGYGQSHFCLDQLLSEHIERELH